MKPLELQINELIEFKNKEKLLYASEHIDGVLKRLYVNLYGGFEVHLNGKCIREALQPFIAVEFYNSLVGDALINALNENK